MRRQRKCPGLWDLVDGLQNVDCRRERTGEGRIVNEERMWVNMYLENRDQWSNDRRLPLVGGGWMDGQSHKSIRARGVGSGWKDRERRKDIHM